jgi:hypothetical protein
MKTGIISASQAFRHAVDGSITSIAATQGPDVGFSPATDLSSTPGIAPDPFKLG